MLIRACIYDNDVATMAVGATVVFYLDGADLQLTSS